MHYSPANRLTELKPQSKSNYLAINLKENTKRSIKIHYCHQRNVLNIVTKKRNDKTILHLRYYFWGQIKC